MSKYTIISNIIIGTLCIILKRIVLPLIQFIFMKVKIALFLWEGIFCHLPLVNGIVVAELTRRKTQQVQKYNQTDHNTRLICTRKLF